MNEASDYPAWQEKCLKILTDMGARDLVTGIWEKPDLDEEQLKELEILELGQEWVDLQQWKEINRDAILFLLNAVHYKYLEFLYLQI